MMLNDVNTPRFGIWLTGFRFHAAAPWMPRLLAAGCAAVVSLWCQSSIEDNADLMIRIGESLRTKS